MADDGGQRFDVHAVFQGGGSEGMPQIMEPQAPALRPLQYRLEPLSDGGRVQRGVLFHRGGEHPSGVNGFSVCLEYMQHRSGEKDRPVARLGLGRGYHQFSLDPVDLPLHSQGAGAEIQVIPLEGQDLAPAPAGG